MAEAKQDSGELFDTASPEEGSPDVSTSEESKDSPEEAKPEESKEEESKETLDLDEKKSTSSIREEAKQKQINAWFKKIVTGEKTLEDLPEHQKWLTPHLEERLLSKETKEATKKDLDVSELVREELSKQKDEDAFKDLKASLNEMKLTSAQKAELSEEFKDLRSDGLSKAKALQKAIKMVGIKDIPDRRTAMYPPKPSTISVKEDVHDDNWREQLPFDKRIEKLNHMTDPTAANSNRFN